MEGVVGTIAGLAVVLAVGSVGYLHRSVDRSGFAAGLLIGSMFVLAGGLPVTFMLITFFLVGSAFTKYKYSLKEEMGVAEMKGGARTWRNVIANLFFPTIAVLTYFLLSWEPAKLAFLASLSGALSDTLGSEIGVLSRSFPVMIHNFRRVPPGTSGAVSPLGTAASLVGAFIIPLEALFFSLVDFNGFIIASTLGFLCSFVDSILGAILQVRYRCEGNGRLVEDPSLCREGATRVSGLPGLDNHAVNLISTGVVAIAAIVLEVL